MVRRHACARHDHVKPSRSTLSVSAGFEGDGIAAVLSCVTRSEKRVLGPPNVAARLKGPYKETNFILTKHQA
jgi:hypothetical protein